MKGDNSRLSQNMHFKYNMMHSHSAPLAVHFLFTTRHLSRVLSCSSYQPYPRLDGSLMVFETVKKVTVTL